MGFRGAWFPMAFLVLLGCFAGCSEVRPQASLTSPFFNPTPEDAPRLATLAHDLDDRALRCAEVSTCEEVHFARGLVSLFESREAARASFRRVIEDNPTSQLSTSSRLWLQLIQDQEAMAVANATQHTSFQLMTQLVRDWMTREFAEHVKQKQAGELTPPPSSMGDLLAGVRALQRQVRERDRRILVLQSQMEDLKRIDQDHEQRKRTIRLPSTLP